jgi:hypothetical protein
MSGELAQGQPPETAWRIKALKKNENFWTFGASPRKCKILL